MAIPKEPRQAMINMMYLVLIALLALNVSAEILNAFTLVNDGIKVSVKALEEKNAGLISALEEKKDNDSTAIPYYNSALVAKGAADSMVNEIDGMINGIFNEAGWEIDESTGDTVLKNPGETHKGHFYMINEGHGDRLQNMINSARSRFLDIVASVDGDTAAFAKTLSLRAQDPPPQEGVRKTWAQYNFGHVPAIAAITLLNKYKNDIRDAEASLIEELGGAIFKRKMIFDKLVGRAISNSSYVNVGEKYEADIFVSATSKSVDPVVYIGQFDQSRITKDANGNFDAVPAPIPLRPGYNDLRDAIDGIVRYEVPATSPGPKKYQGVVEVTNTQTGEKTYYPFEEEYTVAASMAVVSPTKMNVFYIGVDNPVDVSAPRYQPDQVQPSISSGTMTGSKGQYTVNVTTPGDVTVTVRATSGGQTRTVGSKEFRVKRIPDPTPMFGARKSGVIPSAEVKAVPGLNAIAEGFEFDVRFQVVGFEVTYKKARTTNLQIQQNDGPVFSNQVKQIFNQVGPGDKIWIDNIRVKAPDNTTRSLNMSLTVI